MVPNLRQKDTDFMQKATCSLLDQIIEGYITSGKKAVSGVPI
jgi:hypothetical protein